MIHVFIGTKAQYVKTAPVLKELECRGVEYNLIDSGQHADLSKRYREFFQIKAPDHYLSQSGEDIKTVWKLCVWIAEFMFNLIFRPNRMFSQIFRGCKGICIIHGDTPTTLISALAAKRFGIKVIHIEAGLRSYNLFNPFPEEIIRILTMRMSDVLFAPSKWAFENLKRMKIRGKPYLASGNTNIDALRFTNDKEFILPRGVQTNKFVVFSIHRVETILSKDRLGKIVNLVESISKDIDVIFCMHPPTKRQLEKFKYLSRLEALRRVEIMDLLPYPEFVNAIKNAHFVVTDGGSIQEECYFLNIPCLLMRLKTERQEGVDQNVCISEFKTSKVSHFLNNVEKFKTADHRHSEKYPSREIVDKLLLEFSDHIQSVS